MQFSVTTTEKSGILQACERYIGQGDASITGSATLLAEFTNYSNEVLREIWPIIFSVSGGWQYDDGNQTDLPSAVATLNGTITSYALPSTALTVVGIEVKDTSGKWHALTPITDEQIRSGVNNGVAGSGQIYSGSSGAVGDFLTTPGMPLYYQLVGQTVKIYPSSSWSQDESFKVFFDRGSVSFVTTDTTKTPGFASEFHDLVPMGASCRWFQLNSPDSLTFQGLKNDYEIKKQALRDFYFTKSNRLFTPKLRPVRVDCR